MSSGNKTEPPTPKRLREARKKGNVPISRDFSSTINYAFGTGILVLASNFAIVEPFKKSFIQAINYIQTEQINGAVLLTSLNTLLKEVVWLTAILFLPLAIIGIGSVVLHIGFLFTLEPIKPKFNKLNPINQIKNWFSIKGLFELFKTFFKLTIVLVLGWVIVAGNLSDILRTVLLPNNAIGPYFFSIMKNFLFFTVAIFLLLGALDLGFQRWKWKKDLMMTKDEVKREYKEEEGDPEIKARRREIHMELINQQGMVSAVKTADAVVVNPTTLAVVLYYKKGETPAPKVTAKGRDVSALKIRRLARKYNVPVIRNKKLARALFKVDIDSYIPTELYDAVAEVLLFAWKLKREGEGA